MDRYNFGSQHSADVVKRRRTEFYVLLGAIAAFVLGGAMLVAAATSSRGGTTVAPIELPGTAAADVATLPAQPAVATVPTPSPSPAATVSPAPVKPIAFNGGNAMATIEDLAAFGPRKGGTAAERRAAEYLRDRLKAYGYDAEVREFALHNGTTSRNVVARIDGPSEMQMVLGAHMDSKIPSPGANDNASGCAALLEIARILKEQPVTPDIEIVFFGAEEIIDSNKDHHHYGSRFHEKKMGPSAKRRTAGMISIDMIGVGSEFTVRTMGVGPQSLSDALLAYSKAEGQGLSYLKDPGETGWSDHEAFEQAGMPAAWLEWRDDPTYHTAADTPGHVSQPLVRKTGQFVLDFLRSLGEPELASLR